MWQSQEISFSHSSMVIVSEDILLNVKSDIFFSLFSDKRTLLRLTVPLKTFLLFKKIK